MSILRSGIVAGALSICSMSGAFAAEIYVSLGLGVAEEQVDVAGPPPFAPNCGAGLDSTYCAGQLGAGAAAPTAGFDLGNAAASSAGVGLEWGNWRFELEYSGRDHDGQSLPLPSSRFTFTGPAATPGAGIIGDLIEFPAEEPRHEIAGFDSRQIFLNAIYSFRTGVSWRPFVGLGAGVAQIRYRYIAEGLEPDGFPLFDSVSSPDEFFGAPLISLKTVKVFDAVSRDNVLGFQALAGIDRALSEEATAFATLRWSRFEASAAPRFSSVGRGSLVPAFSIGTPASPPDELDGIGGFSLTAGIRYTF